MSSLKAKIHTSFFNLAKSKKNEIVQSISRVQDSLSSESKSTAGDKHETGRAMLQLEREKLGIQLQQAEQLYNTLKKINPEQESKIVILGSYIETETLNYYLSASLGQIQINKKTVFAISPQSPIGRIILGKTIGDSFVFNGKRQTILKIL